MPPARFENMTHWRRVGFRKLRLDTNQDPVLAIVRPPESATTAQEAEATAWRLHTVRSVLAELKKYQGIELSPARKQHEDTDHECHAGAASAGTRCLDTSSVRIPFGANHGTAGQGPSAVRRRPAREGEGPRRSGTRQARGRARGRG
ncbi:DUF3489 domain-containing protein [Dankookia rubra]|uniref:DUF3489 domain-containing protein n=1 Tax=Dankookia rubra TaxID=1442381 RepID=A0A4R5QKM2_9PROT|nr:DUF3489 domain-containing protein [Dankookia rubra]